MDSVAFPCGRRRVNDLLGVLALDVLAGDRGDARTLVRPRAASCGSECTGRPCTPREMRHAQQALEDEPWIGAWAALGVLAHLTGWPPPVPKPEVLAAVRALPARAGQCAISHAVEAAVSLPPVIRRPGTLAAHVSAVLRAWAEHGEWLCSPDEPEWLFPGPLPAGIADGLVQTATKDQAATLHSTLASFIDCQWPLDYLPRNGPRLKHTGVLTGQPRRRRGRRCPPRRQRGNLPTADGR